MNFCYEVTGAGI